MELYAFSIVVLVSAFIILLMGKWGIRDYVIMHAPRLWSLLFSCDFCLAFWVSTLISVIFALMMAAPLIALLFPVMATPLIRMLL